MIRKGDVKRAKLYYLRERTGKSARIADRDRGNEADQYKLSEVKDVPQETAENKPVVEETSEEENHIEKVSAEATSKVEEKTESSASKAENTEDESKI